MWRASRIAASHVMFRALRNVRSVYRAIRCAHVSTSATASGANRTWLGPSDIAVGELIDGFKVQQVQDFPAFHSKVFKLQHECTGAGYIHLARQDADNAFCVAFRTLPSDSTGVPHILEHTALCGSESFPVRDPFFLLTRRSLATFMNALTAEDHTMYPFSTQNERDFENLMSVYLDATFFPLLRPADFLQEGHRLEFASAPPEQKRLLQFKGVVYNEMRGAMSNPDAICHQQMRSHLMPDTGYRHNSGGEPRHITELTYEQLVEFHRAHYQPSNALLLSYGTFAPKLDYIDKVLCRAAELRQREGVRTTGMSAKKGDAVTVVKEAVGRMQQRSFDRPVSARVGIPEDPMSAAPDRQTKVGLAWLLHSISSAPAERELELVALNVIASALLDGPTAPLYDRLVTAGIGTAFAAPTGLDMSTKQPVLSLVLQGVRPEDVESVEREVVAVLQQFEPALTERIEAVLHQLELTTKHVGSHFGLNLLLSLPTLWTHGDDALAALRLPTHLSSLRQRLSSTPTYLKSLVEKHILSNTHRLSLIMSPDEEFGEREERLERERLVELSTTLTDESERQIREQAEQLRLLQEREVKSDSSSAGSASTAVDSCLPSLTRKDIARAERTLQSDFTIKRAPNVLFELTQPTNGLVYTKALFNVASLPQTLRPFVPLFCAFAGEVGGGALDYLQFGHQLERYTGGLAADAHVFDQPASLDRVEELISFETSALASNAGKMMELLQLAVSEPRFDDLKRLHTLLLTTAADMFQQMVEKGHSLAMLHAASSITTGAELRQFDSGIGMCAFISRLAARADTEELQGRSDTLRAVSSSLFAIAKHVATGGLLRGSVVGDAKSLEAMNGRLDSFANAVSPASSSSSTSSLASADDAGANTASEVPYRRHSGQATFFSLPMRINHVAQCLRTVPLAHEDSPLLSLLAQLVSFPFLHREIREKGGAYGSGLLHNAQEGLLSFFSFRDPACLATLGAFKRAAAWACNPSNITNAALRQATLSAFARLDAPHPPATVGDRLFLRQQSDELRQRYRDGMLAATPKSISEVAERYLRPELLESAPVSVVGSEETAATLDAVSGPGVWRVERIETGDSESEPSQAVT